MESKKNTDIIVNANEVSRIASGVFLKGDMSSKSDIRVDGRVEGTLYSEGKIVVGESAVIVGAIYCSSTDFGGQIQGYIYTRDLLSLKETAVVNGGMNVRKLHVEIGARIDGTCHMITEEQYDAECKKLVKSKFTPSDVKEEPSEPAVKPEKK